MRSQILTHDAADGFGGLDLHGIGRMGVGAQRESGIGVAEHTRDRADVDAALERHGGEGVPQIVEADMLKS